MANESRDRADRADPGGQADPGGGEALARLAAARRSWEPEEAQCVIIDCVDLSTSCGWRVLQGVVAMAGMARPWKMSKNTK